MNRSYGAGGLGELADAQPAATIASQPGQLFCPIGFYSKLTAESIDSNENPANIKRLGNALNRMHFNLCDSHHSFIATHQSICTICHTFIEKYESLIFDDQLTDQMLRNQLMIGEPSKPDNELDDKVVRVDKMAASRTAGSVDSCVDRSVDRGLDRNRSVDADCKVIDGRTNGKRPDNGQLSNGRLDGSRLDKNKSDRFCYYCNEIQLNCLPKGMPKNCLTDRANDLQVTVQIGDNSRPINSLANRVLQARPSVPNNHQRHHSDSFIRLKSKCENEQFV